MLCPQLLVQLHRKNLLTNKGYTMKTFIALIISAFAVTSYAAEPPKAAVKPDVAVTTKEKAKPAAKPASEAKPSKKAEPK